MGFIEILRAFVRSFDRVVQAVAGLLAIFMFIYGVQNLEQARGKFTGGGGEVVATTDTLPTARAEEGGTPVDTSLTVDSSSTTFRTHVDTASGTVLSADGTNVEETSPAPVPESDSFERDAQGAAAGYSVFSSVVEHSGGAGESFGDEFDELPPGQYLLMGHADSHCDDADLELRADNAMPPSSLAADHTVGCAPALHFRLAVTAIVVVTTRIHGCSGRSCALKYRIYRRELPS